MLYFRTETIGNDLFVVKGAPIILDKFGTLRFAFAADDSKAKFTEEISGIINIKRCLHKPYKQEHNSDFPTLYADWKSFREDVGS